MATSQYRELIVWQKAFLLTEKIYLYTKKFPKEEIYSLTDQIRRAAVSIPSNIAEWSWRWSNAEYARFLNIAKWSCCELETQILLASKLEYLDTSSEEELLELIEEVLKMLVSIIQKFKSNT
jgi:four helix bundle protein